MDRETWDRWLERSILGLVLAIMVFGPLAYGAVRIQEFVVIEALTLGVIFLWILRLWINPRPILFCPPICWTAIAFVIYAFVRYAIAPIEYVARLELIRIVVYAFLFFSILNNVHRQESIHLVVFVLIALAFGLSIFAVYQFVTQNGKVWGMIKPAGYVLRGSGTFINPNHLAGFLEMILPVGLACTLLSRFGHATKIIIGYACLGLVAGIAVTLSRGGWMAAALTLTVFFAVLFFKREYRIYSIIALALLLISGAVIATQTEWTQTRFKRLAVPDKVEDNRFLYWNSAIQLWREDIWLGTGPGHYDYRFRKYRSEKVQGAPQYAHNDYLNTLADWGLIGLGIITAFLATFYVCVFKSWPFLQRAPNDLRSGKSNKSALVFGGSLGVLAILLHSALDFNMQIPSNAILAVALIAFVSTYLRFATEKFWFSLRWAGRIFLTLAGIAGLLFLGEQSGRLYREHLWLQRAEQEKASPERQLDLLKKAYALEPKNFETAYEIGEIFRARSRNGTTGYDAAAQEAITWYQRSIELNPFNPFSQVRLGMCLDWIGKSDEATKAFQRAQQLDPNGYFTIAHLGWHEFQNGNYGEAKKFFQRSQGLKPNTMAEYYLDLIDQILAEEKKPAGS